MDINRQSVNRRQRPKDPLERRMDKFFETGRQFVDGVAGNRPGKRRYDQFSITNRSTLKNAGRWMGEKLDWFLEDDEDWLDIPEQKQDAPISVGQGKRRLEAISLRVPKAISSSVPPPPTGQSFVDEWPDESSFRVDRWKREKDDQEQNNSSGNFERRRSSPKRPLPKSSRKRN